MAGRRAARTDANHAEIRDGLRDDGWRVADTHALGDGFPDLVAMTPDCRALFLLEVKDGNKPLTDDENDFRGKFNPFYRVVRSLDEARALHVTNPRS